MPPATAPTAVYFYPRSPCGERRSSFVLHLSNQIISIHALLAESDDDLQVPASVSKISIHALLAESDPSSVNMRLSD